MEFGVTFPQTDIETDPGEVRTFAETIEAVGYEHILAYDHILGVEPPQPDWDGSYDYTDQFLEPFVLFSQLAAVTDDVEFLTGVLVLPQRETPLVAKQAATLDALTDGRFTLGAGVGWNDLEYRNLGFDFESRGSRIVEQVDVLRELWADDLIDYDGKYHRIEAAGINPRPEDGSIPIWLGGGADVVLRRIARRADGWIAPTIPMSAFESKLEKLRTYLAEEGRDPETFPIHARVKLGELDPETCLDRIERFDELGVSAVAVGTMNMGLTDASEHLEVIEEFMADLREAGLA
jgi:probable F420-dependent oxidoreductase